MRYVVVVAMLLGGALNIVAGIVALFSEAPETVFMLRMGLGLQFLILGNVLAMQESS